MRLKNAPKTSKKSAMGIMAAAVSQTPSYIAKLNLYVNKSVGMASKGPKAKALLQELEVMKIEEANLAKLRSMAEELPDLVQALLPGTCEPLLDAWAKQVKGHCRWLCKENPKSVNFNLMQDLLSEACGLCPQDTDIRDLMTSCAEILQQRGSEVLMEELADLAAGVCKQKKGDLGDFNGAVEKLGGKLNGCNLPKDVRESPKLAEVFQESMNLIFVNVGRHLENGGAEVKDVKQWLNTAGLVAKWLPRVDVRDTLSTLSKAVALKESLADQKEQLANDAQQGMLGCCSIVQRELLRLKTLAAPSVVAEKPFLGSVANLCAEADIEVEKVKERLVYVSMAGMTTCQENLEAVAGGMSEGKSWLEEWKKQEKQDWDGFLEHAKSTLLNMNSPLLNDLLAQTSSA